jgi:hypothetical protein
MNDHLTDALVHMCDHPVKVTSTSIIMHEDDLEKYLSHNDLTPLAWTKKDGILLFGRRLRLYRRAIEYNWKVILDE